MKIFICSSTNFYDKIKPIKEYLEKKGYIITLPNSYEKYFSEEKERKLTREEHISTYRELFKLQEQKVKDNDAILVLNLEKNGIKNYVGGSVFLEMFKAFELDKKIFLYNSIPESILSDEIIAFDPIILNGDLDKIQ